MIKPTTPISRLLPWEPGLYINAQYASTPNTLLEVYAVQLTTVTIEAMMEVKRVSINRKSRRK